MLMSHLAEMLLREPALVLGREVRAELDVRELPLRRILGDLGLQEFDRLAVRDARERAVDELVEAREQRLVVELRSRGARRGARAV